ncbi:hypothetical protein GCM10018775_07810 [Streptomyces umbrinus]|nr:hypothetical protein GCM10018775_07810 [Streptomyces umbrinus]
MGLSLGQTVVDLGCGTGRVLPGLRVGVGDKGVVLGLDVTSAMLGAAVRYGRKDVAALATSRPARGSSMDRTIPTAAGRLVRAAGMTTPLAGSAFDSLRLDAVSDPEALRRVYDLPSDAAVRKEMTELTEHTRRLID